MRLKGSGSMGDQLQTDTKHKIHITHITKLMIPSGLHVDVNDESRQKNKITRKICSNHNQLKMSAFNYLDMQLNCNSFLYSSVTLWKQQAVYRFKFEVMVCRLQRECAKKPGPSFTSGLKQMLVLLIIPPLNPTSLYFAHFFNYKI